MKSRSDENASKICLKCWLRYFMMIGVTKMLWCNWVKNGENRIFGCMCLVVIWVVWLVVFVHWDSREILGKRGLGSAVLLKINLLWESLLTGLRLGRLGTNTYSIIMNKGAQRVHHNHNSTLYHVFWGPVWIFHSKCPQPRNGHRLWPNLLVIWANIIA